MLYRLDAAGMAAAIGIAASMGAGLLEANRTGGSVKRIHCGWAAHAGVSAAEFAGGHLPQARHFDIAELEAKAPQINKNKKTPLVLVCQTGQRAQKAEALLTAAGYAEVHVLLGGLNAWQQAGMPVVRDGAVK